MNFLHYFNYGYFYITVKNYNVISHTTNFYNNPEVGIFTILILWNEETGSVVDT